MNRRTVLAALPAVAVAGCLSNPVSSGSDGDESTEIGRFDIENADETSTAVELTVTVDGEIAHEEQYEVDGAEDTDSRTSGESLEDSLPFEGEQIRVHVSTASDETEATFDAAGCYAVKVRREGDSVGIWHSHNENHCSSDDE